MHFSFIIIIASHSLICMIHFCVSALSLVSHLKKRKKKKEQWKVQHFCTFLNFFFFFHLKTCTVLSKIVTLINQRHRQPRQPLNQILNNSLYSFLLFSSPQFCFHFAANSSSGSARATFITISEYRSTSRSFNQSLSVFFFFLFLIRLIHPLCPQHLSNLSIKAQIGARHLKQSKVSWRTQLHSLFFTSFLLLSSSFPFCTNLKSSFSG